MHVQALGGRSSLHQPFQRDVLHEGGSEVGEHHRGSQGCAASTPCGVGRRLDDGHFGVHGLESTPRACSRPPHLLAMGHGFTCELAPDLHVKGRSKLAAASSL